MNNQQLIQDEPVPWPPLNLREAYLLRIQKDKFEITSDNADQWSETSGEIRVMAVEYGESVQLALSVGVTGFLTNGEGKFCFLSIDAYDGRLKRTEGRWTLDSGFRCEYLSHAMQMELPSKPVDEYDDQFETPRVQVSGNFSAEYVTFPDSDGPAPDFYIEGGKLVFEPDLNGPWTAPRLELSFPRTRLTRLYTGRQGADQPDHESLPAAGPVYSLAMAAAPAAATDQSCNAGEISADSLVIKVQPIGFSGFIGSPSGQLAPGMMAEARSVWRKACITILPLALHTIPNGALRTSGDIDAIKQAYTSQDSLTIDVFFVKNNLTGGGAKTLDAGTNLGKIFISDNASANVYLLAHEMLHVFRGDHPPINQGDPPGSGLWFGDSLSIADPTNSLNVANVPRNTEYNCDNANSHLRSRNPALQTQPVNCCMTPDA